MNIDALRASDNKHFWHPYTDQVTFESEPYTCIERGRGSTSIPSMGGSCMTASPRGGPWPLDTATQKSSRR